MIRDVHVLVDQGRWAVALEGARRPVSHHASAEEAMDAARGWSQWYGSRLLVHDAAGSSSGSPTSRP
jgi:hypothetical protein